MNYGETLHHYAFFLFSAKALDGPEVGDEEAEPTGETPDEEIKQQNKPPIINLCKVLMSVNPARSPCARARTPPWLPEKPADLSGMCCARLLLQAHRPNFSTQLQVTHIKMAGSQYTHLPLYRAHPLNYPDCCRGRRRGHNQAVEQQLHNYTR